MRCVVLVYHNHAEQPLHVMLLMCVRVWPWLLALRLSLLLHVGSCVVSPGCNNAGASWWADAVLCVVVGERTRKEKARRYVAASLTQPQ